MRCEVYERIYKHKSKVKNNLKVVLTIDLLKLIVQCRKRMIFLVMISRAQIESVIILTHKYQPKESSENLMNHKKHTYKLNPKILFWVRETVNPEKVSRVRK